MLGDFWRGLWETSRYIYGKMLGKMSNFSFERPRTENENTRN